MATEYEIIQRIENVDGPATRFSMIWEALQLAKEGETEVADIASAVATMFPSFFESDSDIN